jgi:hypothetical protein
MQWQGSGSKQTVTLYYDKIKYTMAEMVASVSSMEEKV